jgi:mannose-6-phosphate isomerase-like protein (cupin superfamily)
MATQGNKPVSGAQEPQVQEFKGKQLTANVFGYQRPEKLEKGKGIVRLARSDLCYATVQVLQSGGENNLHAHPAQDGIWIVLKGRVKFYGKDNVVLAELGPMEGIHIPRGYYYWFESSSPEMLEILQMESIDHSVKNERLNATPSKDLATEVQKF